MNSTKIKGLNSNLLKAAAISAMTIDHLTFVIFPGYPQNIAILFLHMIGRLTMPIMCYFIAEGYHYTHNLNKYAARLFLFALISHFSYTFAFGIPFVPFQTSFFNQTSIIWSLAWGLAALAISKSENLKPWLKLLMIAVIAVITFCSDWSCIAVFVIILNGKYRGNFKKQMAGLIVCVAMYSAVYYFFIDKVYGLLQMAVVLSIPLLKMYNGERGKRKNMKWLFYIYYPLHLTICGFIRIALHGI